MSICQKLMDIFFCVWKLKKTNKRNLFKTLHLLLFWKMCFSLSSQWMSFYCVGSTSLYCQLSIVRVRVKQNGRETESQICKWTNERKRDKEGNREWKREEREMMRESWCVKDTEDPTMWCSRLQTDSRIKAGLLEVQQPVKGNYGLWWVSFINHAVIFQAQNPSHTHTHTLCPASAYNRTPGGSILAISRSITI